MDFTFLGSLRNIWVQGGVGLTPLAVRQSRRLNCSSPTTAPEKFRPARAARVGPEVDATLTE